MCAFKNDHIILGEGQIQILNIENGSQFKSWDAHLAPISLLVLNGSHQLFSGSIDGSVKLWDLDTFHCVLTLSGHSCDIKALIITEDGKLITSSNDETIKFLK
jgi:WD40 repeat protein